MYKTNKSTNRLVSAIKRIAGIVGVGAALAASQGASAACTYSIQSEWNSGFVANVTIKNDTGAAINGWSVSWQYSANRMTNGWSANYSGSNPYIATNMPWNGSIPVGQSVTFGFQGVKNNSLAAEIPAVTGAACNGTSSSVPSSSSRSSSISSSSRSSSNSISSSRSSSAESSRSSSSRSSSISSSSRSSSISSSSRSSSISSSSRSSSISSSSRSSSISSSSRSSSSSSAVNQGVAALVVQGNKVTANGQPANLAGMSLFWSNTGWGGEKYFNAQVVSWLKSDWKANLIRVPMGVEDEGGYLSDASNKTRAMTVVDAAIANNMYVIIDWHTHAAELNKSAAIEFFKEMATKYGQYNNVIYEVYNEPVQVSWSNVVKPYAVDVIREIRAIDPDNLIIVGTPSWSQDVDVASQDRITGYSNIAYTLHFYAGTHTGWLRDKAQTALNNGIALFVTEWGTVSADGDGAVAASETATWMNFLKNNGISHANWALNDKLEGASALVPNASSNGGWGSSDLTTSGTLVRNYIIANNGGSSSSVSTSSSRSSSISSSSRSSSLSSSSRSSSSVSSSLSSSSRSSSSASSTSTSIVRLDNPFENAQWYIDPIWSGKAGAETGGSKVSRFNTAVWMDRIGAIAPTDGSYGLRDHLDAALAQKANVILVVVYDLPNRDCHALASNGELKQNATDAARYRTEYVDVIASIFSDAKYQELRIIAIIEPDSLPNLVTNLSDPDCAAANQGEYGYVPNTQYTLGKLYPIKNVYSYVDIGHSGWLGWDDNFANGLTLIGNAIKGATGGVNSIAGFVSNTAGYTPLYEPFLDSVTTFNGTPTRQASFYEWNPYFSEVAFVQAWRTRMIAAGFPSTIGMLVDTSRNGWGGSSRPTAASTSTVLNTFVDASRIDRRTHRGNWCNQKGGIGVRPTVAPAAGIDAYVWVKPPGESDGAASLELSYDPQDPAKGFDRMCDPTYNYSPGTGANVDTGALPNAPVAGRWFKEGFQLLLNNAYPPLE